MKPKHVWMVRAGDDNELAGIVREENVVAIGWMEMGDVSDLDSREQFDWPRCTLGTSGGTQLCHGQQDYRHTRFTLLGT